MIFAISEPNVLIIKNPARDFDSLQYHNQMVIKKVMSVCEKISKEEQPLDPNNLTDEVVKLLPEAALIEYVLNIEQLLTINEFGALFDFIPQFQYYNEMVWPIPFDYTPDNVYDWGRYDINLIFGRQKMKEAWENVYFQTKLPIFVMESISYDAVWPKHITIINQFII